METKFNFKSQIATDKIQSERLLSLGLKKETADMVHSTVVVLDNLVDLISAHPWTARQEVTNDWYPAWSLHRLAFLLDASPYPIYLDSNAYNDIIDDIEELINHNEFNKEFLEE